MTINFDIITVQSHSTKPPSITHHTKPNNYTGIIYFQGFLPVSLGPELIATVRHCCRGKHGQSLSQSEHFVLIVSTSTGICKHGVTKNWPNGVSVIAFAAAIAAHTLNVGCGGTGEVTICPILLGDVIKLSTTDKHTAVDSIKSRHKPDAPDVSCLHGRHTCIF